MRTVWKFPIPLTDHMAIEMPRGAQAVDVGRQGGDLYLWAIVDDDAPSIERHFRLVGTGNPAPPKGEYVGTAHMPPFVWHLFEVAS